RVDQLELGSPTVTPAALAHQGRAGNPRLRVLVEELHVAMGRRRVEVEVVLLHVLAVISLVAAEAEEALLQDGVAAVPERQGEAEPSVVVGDPGDPVLAPAVRPRPRVIVREEFPDRSVRTVVPAARSPLST